jgi:hypothetical protein
MKNLFTINEEEKNRILNLHETATKRHYLSEQQTTGYTQLRESDLKKIIDKLLLREDEESLPDMKNIPLGKVESVQQALVDAGYNIGPTGVDGIYGEYTRGAVLKYQKDNGIKQTGNVGPVTSKRLGVQQLTSGKPSQSQTKTATTQKKTTVPQTNPNNSSKPVNSPLKNPSEKKSYKQFCPAIPNNKGVDKNMFKQYQKIAGELISKDVPVRSACEISYVSIRPKFSKRNFFVVDTRDNNIYLFNKNGEFVDKSYTIDGLNAQSQDAETIAKALWSWDEYAKAAGFKYDGKEQQYKDSTGKNRKYDNELIYDYIDKNKSRFFPKGIYSISGLKTDKGYVGGDNNIFNVTTLDGKSLANAIHGFYNEAPRVKAMQELKKAMGNSSSPKSEGIPDSFIKTVEQYLGTSKFNKSYGCINLPEDFLKIARPYATGALVFVIGETQNNYLVQSDKFFDAMGKETQQCPNIESLGQILPKIDAVV